MTEDEAGQWTGASSQRIVTEASEVGKYTGHLFVPVGIVDCVCWGSIM